MITANKNKIVEVCVCNDFWYLISYLCYFLELAPGKQLVH